MNNYFWLKNKELSLNLINILIKLINNKKQRTIFLYYSMKLYCYINQCTIHLTEQYKFYSQKINRVNKKEK